MKTNLVDLMSRISQLEREYNELSLELRSHCMNIKVIELNGSEQVLEEYPDFIEKFKKYMELSDTISKLKGILYEKNNSLTLSTGMTIQQALVFIQNNRNNLELIKILAKKNPVKYRTTETNNSYFTAKELAYDKRYMEQTEQELKTIIQRTELEISQLNSQMFEIEI